jgi:hypothetical protein
MGRQTHIVRVSLTRAIYRDIEILSEKSLYDLANAIVRAFDFDFDHAFGFYGNLTGNYYRSSVKYELFADMGESDAGSVKKTRVLQAFPAVKARLLFVFDYGDEWHFKVECLSLGERSPKVKYPRIVKVVGTAPEQYPDDDDDLNDEDELPDPRRKSENS